MSMAQADSRAPEVFEAARRPGQEPRVAVEFDNRPLPWCLELRNHSPTGFEWGYAGSGPSQLALAMMTACVPQDEALRYYQTFKSACIARIPIEAQGWKLAADDVRNWLSGYKQQPDGSLPEPLDVALLN